MEQFLVQIGMMFGFGGIVAIILLWQNKQREDRQATEQAEREKRMGARLDEQADMIKDTLISALKDNQAMLAACKQVIEQADTTQKRSNELLEELIELRREEMQVRERKTA